MNSRLLPVFTSGLREDAYEGLQSAKDMWSWLAEPPAATPNPVPPHHFSLHGVHTLGPKSRLQLGVGSQVNFFWLMMCKAEVHWELLENIFCFPRGKDWRRKFTDANLSPFFVPPRKPCLELQQSLRHKPTDKDDGTETKRAWVLDI